MSQFLGPIEGHIVIPGSYTATGGTTNYNFNHPPSLDSAVQKREPFSTVPFAPDPDFVDRPETLAWIRGKCAGQGARAALVGLGGVGKSQLAIHYAHSIRDATPSTFVFWVHAGTKARFEEAYRGLADRLELPARDDPKVNVLSLVNNWLCNESNGKWVIILDNADDVEVFYPRETRSKENQFSSPVTSLADYLPQSRNGSILITSRNKDTAAMLAGGYPNIKEIHAFDENQALQLLQDKLQDTPSGGDTADLLRTLDYIPLAITQAASYLNRNSPRATISSYLDEFQSSDKSKKNLLNQDTRDLRRDRSTSNTIVTALQITFDSVRKESRSAADMLSLMSFFNPQEIPEFALRSYRSSSSTRMINKARSLTTIHSKGERKRRSSHLDYNDDIGILQIYSLVGVTAKRGVLKMHPLVQFCTRAWLSSSGKLKEWRSTYLTLMVKELSPSKMENYIEYKQLVPHIEGFYQNKPTGRSLKKWIKLVSEVQKYLSNQGKYDEAERLGRRALEEREKSLGAQHLDTVASVNNLGLVLHYKGKYEEAEAMIRRALEGYEKALGKHHPYTLTSVHSLATMLRDQEKYEAAEEMTRRALEGREKALGKDHPDTLTSVHSLAAVLQDQGKNEAVEAMIRRALEGREKALGKHHPDTLVSVHFLATILRNKGEYEAAEAMFQRAMEGREKALGKHHPYTLASVQSLATMLRDQEKYEAAEAMTRRTLEGYEKALEKDHFITLASVHSLATMLRDQEKYEAAEEMTRRALEGYEKALGKLHPYTLASVHSLATMLRDQEKYEAAEEMTRRALEGREKAFGEDHPDTLASVYFLATILRRKGEYEAAEAMFRRAMEGREKTLGEDHPDTLKSVYGLAYLLHNQKKYNDARDLYLRACDGLKANLGVKHPVTIACVNHNRAMEQEVQIAK